MKRLYLLSIFCIATVFCFGNHLKGGFFTYRYLGPGTSANTLRYNVKLTVYMDCDATSMQVNNTINFTFFDAATLQMVTNPSVNITKDYFLRRNKDEECITGDQTGCYYRIIEYELASVDLPDNGSGYVIAYQRCCRIISIKNILGNSSDIGNTYSIQIPGRNTAINAEKDSSSVFLVNDTTVICRGSFFKMPFLAYDPNGDSLSFSFCEAWIGGDRNNSAPSLAATPTAASPVIYPAIPYANGFAGSLPLGDKVSIDPKTGLISGVAPTTEGQYVVTVCVNSYRKGQLVATNRKELHVTVGKCDAIQATLNPSYITCDGFNLSFFNQTNNGITTYNWDFGIPGRDDDTANIPDPNFSYPDSGTYVVKLVVNKGQACTDSTTTLAKVYPGFFPGFVFSGFCANKPTQFTDTTKTRYGVVDSWRWDFGETTVSNDTSHLQNPAYTYPTIGSKSVQFIVTNSKGCQDTVTKDITIMDKPPLKLLTKDTLMCVGDTIQLGASGNGIITWTPNSNIINPNTPDPLVYPPATSNYFVELDDNGCVARDTVRVRVVTFVTLQAMPDTTICLTDSIRLRVLSDGLSYTWAPGATLSDARDKNPMALPGPGTTIYTILARIGRCIATDDVAVTTVPYPKADAGANATICFASSAQLNATITGNRFSWSPATSLNNAAILNPVARPRGSTAYVLTVFDDRGCPKPMRDTVLVTVLPEVIAFAGRDTSVVINQPLQLNASGGENYIWSPGTGLSRTNIANPIGIYNGSFDSITYYVTVSDANGCTDTDSIRVKVFRTSPQIFVPSAFTPNGDGRNDVFRPIAVGISKIDYFRVYNRWGQLVFSTTINENGWDGRINGTPQGSNTYVWIVQGTDYTGKVVKAKGTVTLIR